jgi:hypothetical protein
MANEELKPNMGNKIPILIRVDWYVFIETILASCMKRKPPSRT